MIEPIPPDQWALESVPSVFRTCRRLTKNPDSAWEAFQETYLAYTKRRDSLNLESDPTPWLKETARRCSLAVTRGQSQKAMTSLSQADVAPETDAPTPLETTALSEIADLLREELQHLTNEDREILQLAYVDGLSHLDIASRMGCPAGSVHARTERARTRLRKRVERRGVALGMLLLLFLLNGNAEAAWSPTIAPPVSRRSEWIPRFGIPLVLVASLTLFVASMYGGHLPSFITAATANDVDETADSACTEDCCESEPAEGLADTTQRPESSI